MKLSSKLYVVTHILEDEVTLIELITFSIENAYDKVYSIKLGQGDSVMVFEFNLNRETGDYERGDMLLSWNQG